MPSLTAHPGPHVVVLAASLLLLGAATASISPLQQPTLAAAPASGALSTIHHPTEVAALEDDQTGDASLANTPDATGPAQRDNPPVMRPGATDPTISWVAPDGTTGPGVSAIFRVFGKSDGLTWALRVAHCESHYDPAAVNSWSGATGLFQFMPATWNGYFAGWNIWDPVSQAEAALSFYQRGWTYQWECK
jgi:Transglycosylase SLT domain